jgi:hypothetical protein
MIKKNISTFGLQKNIYGMKNLYPDSKNGVSSDERNILKQDLKRYKILTYKKM